MALLLQRVFDFVTYYNYMQQQIQNLKDSELTQVLADGFALLYHRKPKFPVTYLANYLKNYQFSQTQKKKMSEKIAQNKKLSDQMAATQKELKNKQKLKQQQKKKKDDQEKQFLDKITKTQYHEDILNYFCDWIEIKFKLTGVYIGELKNKKKKVNLAEDDSQEAHFEPEAPKLIYFENSSTSHADIMLNKTLPIESVLGRLLTAPAEGEEPPAQGEEGVVKQVKPKDQIFFPSVVDNKQLHFFRFPKLGSFFGIGIKINSYLSNKLFDENAQKIFTYQKEHEQYEKLREERETKFREAYDEKANSGADEQQLQNMEKQFEKQEALIQKPKLKQFDTIKRQFVFGFDTLGQDRELSKQEQVKIKEYVNHLKKCWENAELQGLKSDIDRHLRLADKIEAPHQDTYLKIIGQEDKQVSTSEEVEKYKSNEKLMELEMDTARIDKLKEYLNDQKYEPFLDEILSAKVLKFQEIIKFWLIFTGKKKEQITYPGTNVLDFRKIKPFLTKDQFVNKISQYHPRGSKPQSRYQNYAKWERQQRNLQKIDAATVAAYNIYLAFILRFLQLSAKVRKADRIKRINIMKQQRRARNTRKRQNEKKIKERQAKLASLIAEAQQKQQQFDQEAWLVTYNEAEQNQLHEVGPEIMDEIDRDLQNGEEIIPEQPEPVEGGQNPPAE